ncbi:hypothetical protein BY996DRAFT_2369306 [Phakopsora pachyrhizi]|nr:hypothetical protein BY996DRAFT_2369306 [Phakopsora pachyrhizi]
MAGPRMELFKFGMYVFFPIAIMIHYGDPEWYQKYVLPDKSDFLRLEKMKTSPPRNPTELKKELDQLEQIRKAKKQKKAQADETLDRINFENLNNSKEDYDVEIKRQ